MAKYEITAEMNLKKIIAESREVAQALNEFADNLEQIERKYAEPQESKESDVLNFESEKYVEERLNNYNKLLKSGILDCIKEK